MPLSNSWPDRQTWLHNTNKLFNFIKHSTNSSNPTICSLLVAQLAEHLKERLNFKHVTTHEEAYKLYCACVEFINSQILTGAKAPFVLDSLEAFTHEMHAFRAHTAASKNYVNILFSSNEQALCALMFESIAKKSALIPFLNLEKASLEVLLSVSNFLHAELSSLEHNIHFYIGQYQVSAKSLEEVNRIHLSKVAIQDEQMGEAQPIHSLVKVGTVPAPVDT
uniref:Uncharacterized protein n=1 Tax=Moniliophthora roreri TaxID=221103 RepID=A0A0W0FNJ2_MONRR